MTVCQLLTFLDIPKIHVSALYRTAQHIDNYAPGNFPIRIKVISTEHQPGIPDISIEKLQPLENAFAKANNDKTLLNKVKTGIVVRRFLHHALIAVTIFLFYFAHHSSTYCPAIDQAGHCIEKIKGIFTVLPFAGDWVFQNMIKPLFVCPDFGIFIIGILLIIWLLGHLIKNWMNREFKKFWDRVFEELGLRKSELNKQ